MKISIPLLAVCTLLAAWPGAEAAAQVAGGRDAPPPPAPAPGSAATFRSGAEMHAVLQRDIADGGAQQSSSIALTDQYRGSFVRRTEPNGAITHPGNTEMHYIVEGSGTVETGGTVIRRDGQVAIIQGGESRRVTKGDIIIIPAGSPHRYSEIVEPITYLEWRWVAPE